MAEMETAQAETLEALVEEVKAAMQELTPEARQMALAFVQGLQIGQELANARTEAASSVKGGEGPTSNMEKWPASP